MVSVSACHKAVNIGFLKEQRESRILSSKAIIYMQNYVQGLVANVFKNLSSVRNTVLGGISKDLLDQDFLIDCVGS